MNRILNILKEQGRTQTFLSEKMRKSTNTIYNWCHNVTQPSLLEAKELSILLNCNISDLIDEESENTTTTK